MKKKFCSVLIFLMVVSQSLNAAVGYITNAYSGTISVFDTFSDQVVSTIPVGFYPKSIAITPDGAKVYVANFESCDISVIDSMEQIVIATIPLVDYPHSISISADGKNVFVTHFGSQYITIIDSTQDLVISYTTLDQELRQNDSSEVMVKAKKQQKLYVASFESPYMNVIDCKTREVIATLVLGVGTTDIVFCEVPLITELSSYYGPLSGGNSLTIKGMNFNGVSEVYFGPERATQFNVNSDNEICATIPPGMLGIVNVTVLKDGQISTVNQACQYTYVLSELRPPLSFKGVINSKVILDKTHEMLEMTWKPSPSSDVVLYRIFKGDKMIKEIFADSPLTFTTEMKSHQEARKYEIVAVTSENIESSKVRIKMSHS